MAPKSTALRQESAIGPLKRSAFTAAKLPQFDPLPDSEEPLSPAPKQLDPGSMELAEPPPAVEWFFGLGGTPAGPFDLDQFREQVIDARIRPETLAWTEGMPGWQSVAEIPALHDVMRLAQNMTLMPGPLMPSGIPSLPAAPRTSKRSPDEEEAMGLIPSVAPERYLSKRTGTPFAAWFAVLVAFVFGMTVVYVFLPPPTREVVRMAEVPQLQAPQATRPSDVADEQPRSELDVAELAEPQAEGLAASARIPVANATPPSVVAREASGRAPSSSEPEPASGRKTGLLAGMDLGTGAAPGPTIGPREESSSAASLDSDAIGRTVRRHSPAVRRGCWQPALNSRAADAPSSARVTVTISVAPSGTVQGVSSSGDPNGYPGLSRCIEQKVQTWRFPAAAGATTAKVPFVFAAQ